MSEETTILGAGCFWCTEASFQEIEGVKKVQSGYAGGAVENPTYRRVCSGKTGHAEVAKIVFDPDQVSFDDILDVFFSIHDPTSLNKQGADTGTQYRSVIFYMDDTQKVASERKIAELNASRQYDKSIVTAVEPYRNFFEAEDYHNNYYRENGSEPYCQLVISPKLKKLKKKHPEKLKLQ
jgi:methionine-S-sulfoxide reductase